jgi:hypothetical protein
MSDNDLIRRDTVIAVLDMLSIVAEACGMTCHLSYKEGVVKTINAIVPERTDAGLAMRIAVEMEAHAAIGTTTKEKADAILALIRSTGKADT